MTKNEVDKLSVLPHVLFLNGGGSFLAMVEQDRKGNKHYIPWSGGQLHGTLMSYDWTKIKKAVLVGWLKNMNNPNALETDKLPIYDEEKPK